VNSKTVAKAYKLLERDNIIESKGYRGSFIHPDAKSYCEFDLKEWVHEQLVEKIKQLKDKGVTDSEIRVAFNNIMTNKL